MPARKLGSAIVNISAENPDIDHYWLLGATGAVTMNGYFVNGHGDMVSKSVSFTGTIPVLSAGVTDGVNLATIAGLTGTIYSNYPDAVGVIVDMSGSVKIVTWNSPTAPPDFKANPSNYPTFSAANGVALSQVAKV